MVANWTEMEDCIAADRAAVLAHPVYDAVGTLDALRRFTEHHVWAVWDFMSLVTRLQRDVTCTGLPWTPSPLPVSVVRLVNEIKLGEECDVTPDGTWLSHYQLYVEAMEELGADTGPIRRAVGTLALEDARGAPIAVARAAGAPEGVWGPLRFTLDLCTKRTTLDVAAAFTLGREQLIPAMFERLLGDLPNARLFEWYLQRHVEVDGESHGPAAQLLLTELVQASEEQDWNDVAAVAIAALRHRRAVWDAALAAITDTEAVTV